jgi:hypothetical protein
MEFYVTLQALRILRWLLNFWKTCVLLFICTCFQGSLNRESENSSGIHCKYQPSDHTTYQEAWPLSYKFLKRSTQQTITKTDYVTCVGSGLLCGNCPVTLAGRLSEVLLGQWIKAALNDISQESILKGLKKCCVSCSMNRADALWKIME